MAIDTARRQADFSVDWAALRHRLTRRALRAGTRADRLEQVHYASVTVPVELDTRFCERLLNQEADLGAGWYWRSGGKASSVLASFGAAAQITADGESRFATLGEAWNSACAHLIASSTDVVRFFFGFSFHAHALDGLWHDWPNGLLTLPRFLFRVCSSGDATVTVSVSVHNTRSVADAVETAMEQLRGLVRSTGRATVPVSRSHRRAGHQGGSTTRAEHRAMVEATTKEIRRGTYEKAVMARQLVTKRATLDSVPEALVRLRQSYPDNTTFAVRYGDQCFLGASPERLASATNRTVVVDCLAGTTNRGRTPDEDRALGAALCQSEKNLHEHAVVVRAVTHALDQCATDVTLTINRDLIQLPNVQHLYSRVTGTLLDGASLFDLAARLHPTPATAGHPLADVMAVIEERESFERGWYAGGIGVVNPDGDGTIAVPLRSALLGWTQAALFAGGGIMADSTPDAEWLETELKLRPMRMALGLPEEGGDGSVGE